MSKAPRAAGLVQGQRLHLDPDPREISLLGIFNTLTFGRWPRPALGFTTCAPLFGGTGEGTIELLISHSETEQPVYRYRRWYAAPGPKPYTSRQSCGGACSFRPAAILSSWALTKVCSRSGTLICWSGGPDDERQPGGPGCRTYV